MLGMLLGVVLSTHGFAEETKSPWWRFGWSETAPETSAAAPAAETPAPPAVTSAAPTSTPATDTAGPASEKTWHAWPPAPKWGFSEMTIPDESPVIAPPPERKRSRFGKPAYRQSRPTRNSWAQPPAAATAAAEAPATGPWESVSKGARRMSESTRNAWKKTVEIMTPGDPTGTQVVEREPRVSWWDRMWGSDDEAAEGPQTVTEWMAQDRLDP
jgi:hypothetical protein